MRVEVPWGKGTTPVQLEPRSLGGILHAKVEAAEDPDRIVWAAVTRPEANLVQFLDSAPSPLLVVVNDATRPTPTADVLGVIRPALEAWLEKAGHALAFVIATGTHREALPEEAERIFGSELVEAHGGRIFCHDSKDDGQLVHLGCTRRGTEILVNRLLADARSVLVINSVEPHYFAGYTGGRKSLFPGLAGYETVRANHRLSMEPNAETLTLVGNPVSEDLEEATAIGLAGKETFSIQLVLGRDNRVGFAAAGSLEESFRRAVAAAYTQFVLELDEPSEIVVAVAPHPMDCNFYQTNKAIQSGALAVEDGGILIVVAECPFGLGENQTLFEMLAASESPAQALARADEEEYVLGVQQATRVAEILQRAEVWAVTSLPDETVRAMFMTPFPDVQAAVDAALSRRGEKARILFLTEASITVPRVRGAGRTPDTRMA